MRCSIVNYCYVCLFVAVVTLMLNDCFAKPVGHPDAVVDLMAQVPQWHCMRYRKFELVRRCRSYKNGIRKGQRYPDGTESLQ